MLEVKNLDAFYGAVQVLHGVNLVVNTGEIVGLVGANAAGKSSLMFSLAGLRTTCRGELLLDSASIKDLLPWQRPSKGLVLVPERRRLFPFMTVLENLEVGAYAPAARAVISESLEEVFALLPTLSERRSQVAGSMSGGEQQMLAIARALIQNPDIFLMDEPSEGLSPLIVSEVGALIKQLNAEGNAFLIVEQNLAFALSVAHRVLIMNKGTIVYSGTPDEIRNDPEIGCRFLGMGVTSAE